MGIVTSTPTDSMNYIIELGDRRGVNIDILESEFHSSRFCKGLIAFKKKPILDNTEDIQILRLTDFIEDKTEQS